MSCSTSCWRSPGRRACWAISCRASRAWFRACDAPRPLRRCAPPPPASQRFAGEEKAESEQGFEADGELAHALSRRVIDRVGDGRVHADNAEFAHALDAQRIDL